LEHTEHGEPKGFDPDLYISLSQALDLVMHMHPSARPETVRKFLIGIAIHDIETGICGYSERFEESYVRIDRAEPSLYRATPEHFSAIPSDFWRMGMAMGNEAGRSFAVHNLGHVTELTVSELPYRMRDMPYGELQNERIRLTQFAWGVHFPKQTLIGLAEDPKWQVWADVALALRNRGMRGRPPAWKWDEVKAALTIEASRNPEILQKGPGPILQFINFEMRRLHHEQLPDRKDVDAYVRHFSWLWQTPDPDAPPI
jgi:hypothetical protein